MPERKRAANFTRQEETLVLSLVEKYKDILNNKSATTGSNTLKAETWRKVSFEYNDINKEGIYRDDKVLRKKYENLKKSLKRHVEKMDDPFRLDGVVMKVESEDSMNYENETATGSADDESEKGADNMYEEFEPLKIIINPKDQTTQESKATEAINTNKMSFCEVKRAKYLEHKTLTNELKRKHMQERYKLKLKYMEEKYRKKLDMMENESKLRMRLIKEEFELRKNVPSPYL